MTIHKNTVINRSTYKYTNPQQGEIFFWSPCERRRKMQEDGRMETTMRRELSPACQVQSTGLPVLAQPPPSHTVFSLRVCPVRVQTDPYLDPVELHIISLAHLDPNRYSSNFARYFRETLSPVRAKSRYDIQTAICLRSPRRASSSSSPRL